MPSKTKLVCCILLLLGLTACTSEQANDIPPRPVAGDRVTPVILLGKSWKQEGPVLVSARLQVQGENDPEPRLLQLEEIPYDIVPRVTLTFFNGKEKLQQLDDVDLKRDC